MPIEFSVNIAYDDVYADYETVDIKELLRDIPTKMALNLVCHFTGQIHTQEKNPDYQVKALHAWTQRFDRQTLQKLANVIGNLSAKHNSSFNFINNVSSLYLVEALLAQKNDLPLQSDLTPVQEENLFKAYLYYSAKWTKEQEEGIRKYMEVSIPYMTLAMMLPYTELFEFKDFRIQFLKAVYFFQFCENDELFKSYLEAFLQARGLNSWNEYLFNLLSVYVTLLQPDSLKTVLTFSPGSKAVFDSLQTLCVDPDNFAPALDFLTLRETPIYQNATQELLFLNINFLIDKIYHSIIFDFADVLMKAGLTYKGKSITTKPQFFGIFGDEFIEAGLFFKVMQYIFRQKDYRHFTGEQLKQKFGDGAPDYLIIDNTKVYVFEFKNAIFNGAVKYSFDIDKIISELDKKLVKNEGGKAKGVTQLVNFVEDVTGGRYAAIMDKSASSYIIYPVLVTTDFTFILPVVYSLISQRFSQILKNRNLEGYNMNVRPFTMIDLDSLVKFQDLFIQKRLTLNHVLNDYQVFLSKGTNEIDKSLSFQKYIHIKTATMKYETPKLFWTAIRENLLNSQIV